MTSEIEFDQTDRAEQEALADPVDDAVAPGGGPDLIDEADWIDQRTEAPLDDPQE